jgi:undecaprenyl diphosphate synthase
MSESDTLCHLPNHVAIIPDGNRRWAKSHNLPVLEGHRRGAKRFKELAAYARQKGIHTLTAWGFSTENWSRDSAEVTNLMELFIWLIREYEPDAHTDQIRIRHLGRKDRLPAKLLSELNRVEESTAKYDRHDFNICIDYGGQDEIIRAVNNLLNSRSLLIKNYLDQLSVSVDPSTTQSLSEINMRELLQFLTNPVTTTDFAQLLDTHDQLYPCPDLLIRTSGEHRTSGLLPFQSAYTELYFEPSHLPDFTIAKLELALSSFTSRDRRFGGNSTK